MLKAGVCFEEERVNFPIHNTRRKEVFSTERQDDVSLSDIILLTPG